MGNNIILNTTNGKVYIPKKSIINEELKWKEFISFKSKKELKLEHNKLKKEKIEYQEFLKEFNKINNKN